MAQEALTKKKKKDAGQKQLFNITSGATWETHKSFKWISDPYTIKSRPK